MEPEPEAASETPANPDSLPGEPVSVDAQLAYEFMVGRLSGEFTAWDELPVSARGAFKARFAQVQALPIFEQVCAELLFGQ